MVKQQAIDFCKQALLSLRGLKGQQYGETWCCLKMQFLQLYHPGVIFSTRFGADFFEETLEHLYTGKLLTGDPLGEYDRNFNKWLFAL